MKVAALDRRIPSTDLEESPALAGPPRRAPRSASVGPRPCVPAGPGAAVPRGEKCSRATGGEAPPNPNTDQELLRKAAITEEDSAMDDRMTVYQLRLDECEVALDKVLVAADQQARPLVPFEGTWQDRPVVVTAVLQQTVVLYPADTLGAPHDRQVVRRADVTVHPGRLRWKEARPTRSGDGLVLQVQQRPRRCSDCRRTSAETEFRAYKAAYCVECSRRRQAVINRNRRRVAA